MSTEIKFEGLDNITEKLDNFADVENVKKALQKACSLVERAAKQKAPKGNGELRKHIKSRVEGTEGIVFNPLEYAPYVEFGTGLFAEEQGRQDVPWHYQDEKGVWHSTSGMKPHPYLRPALEENREEILRLIGEALTK